MKKSSQDPSQSARDELAGSIEKLTREASEWKEKYLRALADYQNLERRTDESRKEAVSQLEETFMKKLLPVVDLFDKVVMYDQYKNDTGITAIYKELQNLIQAYGVGHMTVVGLNFDPYSMECIEVRDVEMQSQDEKVLEEVLKGYEMRGKQLRPAKVVVGKKKTN